MQKPFWDPDANNRVSHSCSISTSLWNRWAFSLKLAISPYIYHLITLVIALVTYLSGCSTFSKWLFCDLCYLWHSVAFPDILWQAIFHQRHSAAIFSLVFCFCSIKSLHRQHQLRHQKHHQRMEPQFLQEHKDAFDVSTFEVWSVWCLDWMFYANDPSPTKQLLDMLCRLMILHRKTNRITVNKSRHVTWVYNHLVIDLFRNPFHLHPLIALTVSHDLMFPSCSSSSYKFTNRAVQNWWMTRENNSKYCIAFWLFLPD